MSKRVAGPMELDYEARLRKILSSDERYGRAAYYFAFLALEYTLRQLLNLPENKRRHVSAPELLNGMRQLAVEQYGFLARHVWESWGVYETEDWGNVIYNLIAGGLMSENDEDSREDFVSVYDFDEAFDRRWSFASEGSGG